MRLFIGSFSSPLVIIPLPSYLFRLCVDVSLPPLFLLLLLLLLSSPLLPLFLLAMADAGSNPLITSLLSLRELHKRQREYALGKLQYERDVSTARDRQEAVDRVQEERALLQEERDRLRRQLLAVERDLAESRRLEASMMSWKEEADQQVRSTQSRLCGPLKGECIHISPARCLS